ncbi:hypothetical protein [Bifidobacterium animalis]|uniref:hypothetical protein n=1 Tax=Bifidobacterium animalis TaxID=28025 RepID=UPI001BD03EE3|nr:hypothetical protein [Bifidobacterium animalis]
MTLISQSLVRSPLVRFSDAELARWGDGLVRNAGGQPIDPLSGGRVLTDVEIDEEMARHVDKDRA